MTKTHVVFASGGIGSYIAGKRVRKVVEGTGDRLLFLFTDTRSEDKDLYRFLIESVAALTVGSTPDVAECLSRCQEIPDRACDGYGEWVARVQEIAGEALPSLIWLADGRDLWTLFEQKGMIANSRIDVCSHTLKRQIGRKWIEQTLKPEETVLYFGIDNSERERFYGNQKEVEEDRTDWANYCPELVALGFAPPIKKVKVLKGKVGIRERWKPYPAEAPLCEDLYLSKCEMLAECVRDGLEPPRVYDKGYQHNNCGMGGGPFCVKSGHAGFLHLLRTDPQVFDYHSCKEQQFRERTGKDVAIMRDRSGGTTKPLPMAEFKRQVESGERKVNSRDFGQACQCFTPDEEDEGDRQDV